MTIAPAKAILPVTGSDVRELCILAGVSIALGGLILAGAARGATQS